MKSTKKKIKCLAGTLLANLFLLKLIHLVEEYFGLNRPALEFEKEIWNDIYFFLIFVIVVAPITEELLYRMPLKKNRYTFLSLTIGVVYLFVFDLYIIKIPLLIYILGIVYLRITNKSPTISIFTLSLFVFVISHVENYSLEDWNSTGALGLCFILLPQLIVGIITTILRVAYSFPYSLAYHMLYNSAIMILAILSD